MPTTIDTAVALVSLADLKEYLGETGTADDSRLSAIINGVSQRVHDFLGRNILSKSYTHHFDGTGRNNVVLPYHPVTAVAHVYEDPLQAFGASTEIPATDYFFERCGFIKCKGNRVKFLTGDRILKISYTAGWALASLPAAIKLAVCKLAAAQYYKAVNRRHDVQSESLGDKNITYQLTAIPADVEADLQPYVLQDTPDTWYEEVASA